MKKKKNLKIWSIFGYVGSGNATFVRADIFPNNNENNWFQFREEATSSPNF